ncbi:AI-2E family transporter [Ramlibacter ginsenosidimutans]|nr:AI-2E family transporter [Ramlibacter ginsenosidimutans]
MSDLSDPPGDPGLAPAPVDSQEPPRVLLHMPVDVRNMALGVLMVLAVLAVLRWAAAFFIPLFLGLVFSYALSPLVDWLQRLRVPRSLSAAVLVLGILGGMGAAAYSFSDDANDLVASLPEAARKLRDSLHRTPKKSGGTLDSVQKAATELQRAAEEAGGPAPGPARGGVAHVIVEKPSFDLREHLVSGTLGLATLVGQVVVVTCLTFFLLAAGDTYRRKLVKITGPGLAEKKLTVQALDEITAQMQRYLLVQLLASVGTGLATGICFGVIGLKHAAVWGIAAGIMNLIPYVGPIAITAGAALVAFLQFGGSPQMALLVGGASLVIDTLKGYVLVPWVTSKATRMNAVAVFVGVLGWGWMWGVWGLLLGMPILMAVKAVCDRVDHLKPIGELLAQ